jgi:hypothetical protein
VFRWRSDGDLVKKLPATRRIMPLIMRRRNESAVYFEQKIDPRAGQAFLDEFRDKTGLRATWTHLMLFAMVQALHKWPRMNRFVAGGRLWQRRGIWISFSAKKKKDHKSAVVVLKRRFDPDQSFEELVRFVEGDKEEGRSSKKSRTDKELGLLFSLPLFVTKRIAWLLMWADHAGLLPRSFVDGDPMYGSIFLANLGSIQMDAAHHHLYEYGNISIFAVAGGARDEVVAADGEARVEPRITFKYTFDERIEDGLYCASALEDLRRILEHPPTDGDPEP